MSSLLLLLAMTSAAADWPCFRGPGGASVSDETGLPASLGDDELAWRVDLPGRGSSSPIVVGGRAILTCSSGVRGDRLHVLALDASTGKRLWERQLWATGRTMCHPKTCMATPTPASDGKRIYAFWSTNDLACLDLDGNLLWYRGLTHDYPNASNSIGMSSSPLAIDGAVVVQVENQSHSFAAAIDAATGENRWKIGRPTNPSWSSPVFIPGGKEAGDAVVLESWYEVSAVDPATGRTVWALPGTCNCIPSAAVDGGIAYVPTTKGLTAIRHCVGPGEPPVLWRTPRLGPGMSSPIVRDGKIYSVNGAGVIACGDAADGKVLWQVRLEGAASATPVLAGGSLYAVTEDGIVHVVRIGEKGEVTAKRELAETILASPAVSGGAIFIRSDAHLWKFAHRSS